MKTVIRENTLDNIVETRKVYLFVRHIIHRLLKGAWGSERNERVFDHFLQVFVSMGRTETLSTRSMLSSYRLANIPWLVDPRKQRRVPSAIAADLAILERMLQFVYEDLVVPLLKQHFYITETTFGRGRLYYFRHDTWQEMVYKYSEIHRASMFDKWPVVKKPQ